MTQLHRLSAERTAINHVGKTSGEDEGSGGSGGQQPQCFHTFKFTDMMTDREEVKHVSRVCLHPAVMFLGKIMTLHVFFKPCRSGDSK